MGPVSIGVEMHRNRDGDTPSSESLVTYCLDAYGMSNLEGSSVS